MDYPWLAALARPLLEKLASVTRCRRWAVGLVTLRLLGAVSGWPSRVPHGWVSQEEVRTATSFEILAVQRILI